MEFGSGNPQVSWKADWSQTMSSMGRNRFPLPIGRQGADRRRSLWWKGPRRAACASPVPQGIRVEKNDGLLEREARRRTSYAALHGLTRARWRPTPSPASAKGFALRAGHRGHRLPRRDEARRNVITFYLGYSHPIEFVLPPGIECKHGQADAHRSSAASTNSWSARWRPTSQPCARRIRTKQKGIRLHRRSAAQEGRQDRRGWQVMAEMR